MSIRIKIYNRTNYNQMILFQTNIFDYDFVILLHQLNLEELHAVTQVERQEKRRHFVYGKFF